MLTVNRALQLYSVLRFFQTLVPKGCCRIIHYSNKYEDTWKCNFLGLKPAVVVPAHVKLYIALEIKDPELPPTIGELDYAVPPPSDTNEFAKYTFTIKTSQPMPEKGGYQAEGNLGEKVGIKQKETWGHSPTERQQIQARKRCPFFIDV